jgi:hypothetical protein
VLFDGLMRQSEINCLLDEIFGEPEGVSQYEAEGVVLTLYEVGRGRTQIMPSCLLLKAAYVPHDGGSATGVLVSPGSFLPRKSIACTPSFC